MSDLVSTDVKRKLQLALARIPQVRLHPHPRVVVLSYHSINPSVRGPGITTPEAFEGHMRWLRRHCDVVPLAAIPERALRRDPRPTVAVTLDDGFADNFSQAMPILLRYEIPATFFIATGLIDRDPDVLATGPPRCREEGSTLTWDQISEMQRAGMEFGAHGHRHVPLALLSDADAHEDLARSKRVLEQRLEQRIDSVAYPFGRPRRHVSDRTLHLAEEVGFQRGALVLYRRVLPRDKLFGIPRFVVNDDAVEMVRAKVLGSFDVMGFYQERAPLWAVRIIAGRYFHA